MMKKMMTSTICALATMSVFAGPINPMDYYQHDNISQDTLNHLWNNMTTNVDGDDCYRRAQIWSVGMKDKSFKQVKVRKIFIHYTDKFNLILDDLGDRKKNKLSGFLASSEDLQEKKGLTREEAVLYKSNITWDYHVAPLAEVNGVDVVMDKTLKLPYSEPMPYDGKDVKIKLEAKKASVDEWLEALTYRGEMLWKIRKKLILSELAEAKQDLRKSSSKSEIKKLRKEISDLNREFKSLDMDKKDGIDISCTQVTSMAEVDAAQRNAWCFYSIVPMYYYNEMDLRNLAYGKSGWGRYNYAAAVPTSMATAENFAAGADFIQNDFFHAEIKDALKEINDSKTKKKYKAIAKISKLEYKLKTEEKSKKRLKIRKQIREIKEEYRLR